MTLSDTFTLQLTQNAGHQVDHVPTMSEDELCRVIGQYDGLVVRSATKVTEKVLKAATNLQVVGRAGVGVDNINVSAATKAGVMVMNTPDGNTASTAQLALSLLANLARKLPACNISIKSGEWDRKAFMGAELTGKTLGVVGCGRIGQSVAHIALEMGLKVIGYDPVMTPEAFTKAGIAQTDLNSILAQSDFITVHTPLTADTKHLLNSETMAKCKDGVLLINCARGGIIDETALLDALNSGKVAGAALDVYSSEPPKAELEALLSHPHVVCTPHLGASTEEAQLKVAADVAVQMCNVFSREGFEGVLNVNYMAASTDKHMTPFMHLAYTMGVMLGQMVPGQKANRVSISTMGGKDVRIDTTGTRALLNAKLLQGLVKYQVEGELPPLISAPLIATENNIESRISEDTPDIGGSYNNLVHVAATYADGTHVSIAGAVFGSSAHIVHLDLSGETDQFTFKPEGDFLLMFKNDNRPGVLRDVLRVLDKFNVNVGNINIAPLKEAKEQAFCFAVLDDDIPKKAMNALSGLDSIKTTVKMSLR